MPTIIVYFEFSRVDSRLSFYLVDRLIFSSPMWRSRDETLSRNRSQKYFLCWYSDSDFSLDEVPANIDDHRRPLTNINISYNSPLIEINFLSKNFLLSHGLCHYSNYQRHNLPDYSFKHVSVCLGTRNFILPLFGLFSIASLRGEIFRSGNKRRKTV